METYAEHGCETVSASGKTWKIDAPHFRVRLQPGAGGRLSIAMRRYVHQPTLAFPWDQEAP